MTVTSPANLGSDPGGADQCQCLSLLSGRRLNLEPRARAGGLGLGWAGQPGDVGVHWRSVLREAGKAPFYLFFFFFLGSTFFLFAFSFSAFFCCFFSFLSAFFFFSIRRSTLMPL